MSVRQDRNNRRVFIQIENLEGITRRSIRHGFFRLARDLRDNANREILHRPKSGRTYIVRSRNGRRRRHVASAPGETHANLTGTLRRSLGWQVHGSSRMEFGFGVDKPAPDYAQAIEEGTRDGRIQARRSLGNSVDALERNAENYFDNEFKRLIR